MSANDKVDEAKNELTAQKDDLFKRLEGDGVVNPKGLAQFWVVALFGAAVPLTSWLAQPAGVLEKAVNAVCNGVALVASAGADSKVAQSSKVAALSALYIAVTYGASGAWSVAGVNAANKEGRDNNHPRAQVQNLSGLPLRLYSSHINLMENFGGFALSAALAQTMAPGDQTIVNLLGLHVICKVFVYCPSYLVNIGPLRSMAHVLATSSVINVALKLSKQP